MTQQFSVEFKWDNPEKSILRFIAHGEWTWKDFHRAAHVARFAIPNAAPQVDIILDLTQSARTPSGITAHIRTIGKPEIPQLTGRVIVIGLEQGLVHQLTRGGDTLSIASNHTIYFVENEAAAETLLQSWKKAP
ncbi:MAG: hypothetical protein D6712_19380 [Chloroflexi bacterium]|nr:MAG: hypothetical protein D6712_19380 [Chloroflexota bacterium]